MSEQNTTLTTTNNQDGIQTNSVAFAMRRLSDIVPRLPQRQVFASVIGSYAYGFSALDSDIDIRSVYMLSPRKLVSLRYSKQYHSETIVTMADQLGIHLDVVSIGLLEYCRKIVNGDVESLEMLYSPLVVAGNPALYAALQDAARPFIQTRSVWAHYNGFFHTVSSSLENPTWKALCHAYRTLLVGLHAATTGEMELNVRTLAETYGVPEVQSVVYEKSQPTTVLTAPAIGEKYHLSLSGLYDRFLEARRLTVAEEPEQARMRLEDVFWEHNIIHQVTLAVNDW